MWCLRRTLKTFVQQSATRNLQNYGKVFNTKKHYSVIADVQFKEGMNIEGFLVKRIAKVPEFDLTAVELKHENTGADYLHLARNDSNNAFSVGFRTTPFDSTGVPHILEHLCTCGSVKYPCRDPYFKMLCRSMATFMNAMTGPDFTIYPFSTQNPRDYMNLMSVYMDAVFKPMLRRMDFTQEGWRLEHRETDNDKTPIIFKGVVLNEMKGVFSDNQTIFFESIMNNLLPSHTYSVISGGDPLKIPTLTYEALIEFHKKHYHPSNSKFYSYGNFPLQRTLQFINNEYLDKYGKIEKLYSDETSVPLEPRWTSPIRKHINCRVDQMANPEKQSSISVSYLCDDVCNAYGNFVWNILAELLVSGPNSPLYRALVEPNISSGFSPNTGYCNSTRSTFFSVGLQGLNPKDFDWVLETYHKAIDNVIEKGFDEKNVEGVLHSIELGIKHQSSDFGLGLLFNITSPWIHDSDVFEFLNFNKNINEFIKNRKENPRLLQDKVLEHLKNNTHSLILSMSPCADYDKEINKLEEDLLASKLNSMSNEQIRSVYDDGLLLKMNQEVQEDTSCLPTLKMSDLSKDIEHVDVTDTNLSGVAVQTCVQPTNGLTYFYGVLSLDDIPDVNKDILPIFSFVADKLGTQDMDYRKFDQEVLLSSKGFNISYFNSESLIDTNVFEEGVSISSVCLSKNSEKMLKLWSDLFKINDKIVLQNKERFQTLLSEMAVNYLNSILSSGHLYAMMAASSLISNAAKRKEIAGGMTMVRSLQTLSNPSQIDNTMCIVKDTAYMALNQARLRVAVNTTPEHKDLILNQLNTFCSFNNQNIIKSQEKTVLSKSQPESSFGIHHVVPGQVSFAGKSILAVPYTHNDFAALRVFCRLVTMKYCIPVIREKEGAYGAGLNISTGGILSFYSYRDPNPVNTLIAFDETYDWVLKTEFSKQDIEEAKLGTFQSVDAPIPPGQKGLQRFYHGLDYDTLRKHRLALMAVTGEDLLEVASKYVSCHKGIPQGRSVLGPYNEAVIKRVGEMWTVIE